MAKSNIDSNLNIVEAQIDELKRKLGRGNSSSYDPRQREKLQKDLDSANAKKEKLEEKEMDYRPYDRSTIRTIERDSKPAQAPANTVKMKKTAGGLCLFNFLFILLLTLGCVAGFVYFMVWGSDWFCQFNFPVGIEGSGETVWILPVWELFLIPMCILGVLSIVWLIFTIATYGAKNKPKAKNGLGVAMIVFGSIFFLFLGGFTIAAGAILIASGPGQTKSQRPKEPEAKTRDDGRYQSREQFSRSRERY